MQRRAGGAGACRTGAAPAGAGAPAAAAPQPQTPPPAPAELHLSARRPPRSVPQPARHAAPSAAVRTRKRGDGVAGMTVAEISVRGDHAEPRHARSRWCRGPTTRPTSFTRATSSLDGTVKAVTPQGLVIVQEVNDPLSLVKAAGSAQAACDRWRTPRSDCDEGPCPVSDAWLPPARWSSDGPAPRPTAAAAPSAS